MPDPSVTFDNDTGYIHTGNCPWGRCLRVILTTYFFSHRGFTCFSRAQRQDFPFPCPEYESKPNQQSLNGVRFPTACGVASTQGMSVRYCLLGSCFFEFLFMEGFMIWGLSTIVPDAAGPRRCPGRQLVPRTGSMNPSWSEVSQWSFVVSTSCGAISTWEMLIFVSGLRQVCIRVGVITRRWDIIIRRCSGTLTLRRRVVLVARWLHEPQPRINQPVGLGS